MSHALCVRRLWIAGSAALLVGAALLVAWLLARDPLPAGAIVVPRDAPTLAAALEQAKPGAVIVLDARHGPFEGGVAVDVPEVEIRSRNGPATVGGTASPLVSVAADRVAIRGLTFDGTETGLVVDGAGCQVRDVAFRSLRLALRVAGPECVVENVSIDGGRVGLELTSSGARIETLTVQDVSDVGVHVRDATACELVGIDAEACPLAILVDRSSVVRMETARVRDADTAVRISGGQGIFLENGDLRRSAVGVHVRDTDRVRIVGARIAEASRAGVAVEQAKRTEIRGTSIGRCDVGVRVSGSTESALADNALTECRVGLRCEGGKDDLVARNLIRGGDVGVWVERAADVQILRNVVRDASVAGVVTDRVERGQLLDTTSEGCGIGVAVVGSADVAVLRADIRRGEVGIALVNGVLGNVASGNRVRNAADGILIAGASRDAVVQNDVSRCERGVVLSRIGYGVRVESNEIGECAVGLLWSDGNVSDVPQLAGLGLAAERAASVAAPLVSSNVFRGSGTVDAQNDTETLLLVGGNSWSGAAASVRGNVRAPDSSGTMRLALGTSASTADVVVGRLLEWLLVDRGVRVIDLVGLGRDTAVGRALDAGDLDVAWATDGAGASEIGVRWPSPLVRGWTLAARAGIDRGRPGAVAVTVAVPDGVDPRVVADALVANDLTAREIVRVETAAEAERRLKFGSVDCAVVDKWEETVTLSGFVALAATGLGGEPLGLRVRGLDPEALAALRAAYERLLPHLSDDAVRGLASRVRLLGRDPADVAMEFLLREGLVEMSQERGTR